MIRMIVHREFGEPESYEGSWKDMTDLLEALVDTHASVRRVILYDVELRKRARSIAEANSIYQEYKKMRYAMMAAIALLAVDAAVIAAAFVLLR